MNEERQRITLIVVLVLAVLLVLFFSGGKTVAILNRTGQDLCEAYFSYNPGSAGWGENRLGGRIPPGQSRDVNLPVFFTWLDSGTTEGFSGRVLDCNGTEVARINGIQEKLFLWEVR